MSREERGHFFLTAREIFDLRLNNTDIVTLRACSSGRSLVTAGDELIGLSRAFLYAGTPSLIVTLWNVYIQSSYKLLKEFYRLWLDKSNPMPKWKALQLAQIALLKDPDTEKFHHPYHWAPIILIGDWL
jgi:CHAT domain-containing protein